MKKSLCRENATAVKLVLVVAVVLIVASRFGAGSARADYTPTSWYYSISGSWSSTGGLVAAGNVHGGVEKEVVMTLGSSVVCLSASGDKIWECSRGSLGYALGYATPMLVDVDGDSRFDVVVVSSSRIICINGSSGTLLWEHVSNYCQDSGAAGDIDEDSIPEVIAITASNVLRCINGRTGSLKWENNNESYLGNPFITDIEGDGHLDVLAGTTTGKVVDVFGTNGSRSWTAPLANTSVTILCIGDVDKNNIVDIIAESSATIHCVSGASRGSLWSTTSPGSKSDAALCDVNKDGELEMVVLGTYLRSHSARTGIQLWSRYISTSSSLYRGLMQVADHNGDGITEIMYISSSSTFGSIPGSGGNPVTYTVPYLSNPWDIFSAYSAYLQRMALSDLNNDGSLDTCYSINYCEWKSSYSYLECARIFLYDGSFFSAQPGPWPCYKGSVLRTNLLTDSDRDNVTDCLEACIGTDAHVTDTDNDGASDGRELVQGTNPLTIQDPRYPPSLSSGLVSPRNGTFGTNFTFEVTYTNLNNSAPQYVQVNINNKTYFMTKKNSSDVTYANGCVYSHNLGLQPGSYVYSFKTSNAISVVQTTTYTGLVVTNTNPVLSTIQVTPFNSTIYVPFTFNVTYTDAENNPPSFVQLYIYSDTGWDYWIMSKQNKSDTTYTDGCTYTFSHYLAPGSHPFYARASDGVATVVTPTYTGVTVTNNPPSLTSETLFPLSGTTSTAFTFTVIYTDPDNNQPSYVGLYIDDYIYVMSKFDSSDFCYSDGCTYTYTCTLALGSHKYYIRGTDGYAADQTATYSGPVVADSPTDSQPVLLSGLATPQHSTPLSPITFTVNYLDAENQAPTFIFVQVAGSNHVMTKQQPMDTDYFDGCTYEVRVALPAGIHSYQFLCSDGTSTTTTATSTVIVSIESISWLVRPSTCFSGQQISFDGSCSLGFGRVTNWSWQLGDGTLAVPAQYITHVYTTPGTFAVTLTITTDYNVTTTSSRVISILSVSGDEDGDGLANGIEQELGTNIWNPDSDQDGLIDGTEVRVYHTNPSASDTDADGLADGWEVANDFDPLFNDSAGDTDVDGLVNLREYQLGSDPHDPDSDDDGLGDGAEMYVHHTNPNMADTDGDKYSDGQEVFMGTNPIDALSNPTVNGLVIFVVGAMVLILALAGSIVVTKHRYARTNARISQLLTSRGRAVALTPNAARFQRSEAAEVMLAEARRRQLTFFPNSQLNHLLKEYRDATEKPAILERAVFSELAERTRVSIIVRDFLGAVKLAEDLRTVVIHASVTGIFSAPFKNDVVDAINSLIQLACGQLDKYLGQLDSRSIKEVNDCRALMQSLGSIHPRQTMDMLLDALSQGNRVR